MSKSTTNRLECDEQVRKRRQREVVGSGSEKGTGQQTSAVVVENGDTPHRCPSEDRDGACPNGDPRCGGPEADELPCFECYRQRGEAA